MTDLTTTYLGLTLRSPIVPSAAAPLSEDLDNIRRLEDAGAGAIVLHSLFEEQLLREKFELHHHLEYGTESFAESLSYFPEPEEYHVGPELYLDHIRSAKAAIAVPVIASLNGFSAGGWVEYARLMAEAGADALELNLYLVPTDPDRSGADIEQLLIDTLTQVRQEVTCPIAVKLSPFFSSLPHLSKRLAEGGANGLVLFNRFMQPDIDPEILEVHPQAHLSSKGDLRLPLRWLALLYGRVGVDFASSGGVQRGRDIVKLLMAGAQATQVCSALLRHGIPYLAVLERELRNWMEEFEYGTVREMQGILSQRFCPDASAYERAQYVRAVSSYEPTFDLETLR